VAVGRFAAIEDINYHLLKGGLFAMEIDTEYADEVAKLNDAFRRSGFAG
jgi:hypothetical protein